MGLSVAFAFLSQRSFARDEDVGQQDHTKMDHGSSHEMKSMDPSQPSL